LCDYDIKQVCEISKYKSQVEHNKDIRPGKDYKKTMTSILQSRQQMEPWRKRRRGNGIRNSQRRIGDWEII